jgi:SET family sugar efflux transporter-like MFS transporter
MNEHDHSRVTANDHLPLRPEGPLVVVELLATDTILLLPIGRTYPQMLAGTALEELYLASMPASASARRRRPPALARPATGLKAQAYDIQAVVRLA